MDHQWLKCPGECAVRMARAGKLTQVFNSPLGDMNKVPPGECAVRMARASKLTQVDQWLCS